MQILEHRLQRGQVEPAGAVLRHAEIAPRDLAAEGCALKVEETRRALQVGQGLGIRVDQAVELGPRRQLKPQDLNELRIVPLQDAEQVRDVAAIVVDHFAVRPRRAAQENPAHSDERLGIGRARRRIDDRTDPLGEVPFAAKPGFNGRDR